MNFTKQLASAAGIFALSSFAFADSIDPERYSASLEVGESVTITKTVTVDEGVDTGLIDVVFLIDTSGSMGDEIAAAKAAAADILAGLSAFGSLGVATGYYSDPGSDGTYFELTTDLTQAKDNLDEIELNLGGWGGDFPEEGIYATYDAASNTAWRPGSNRFVIALGDANFKESDDVTMAMAQSALADSNATFIGIDFGSMESTFDGGINPAVLADATGGSIIDSSASAEELTAAILEGVTTSFSKYSTVGISDFDAGLPGIDVSVSCVAAAAGGACDGANAVGAWTRETTNEFTFEVTFTAMEEGSFAFGTHALVDGGIVATEKDDFRVGGGTGSSTPASAPGTLLLLGLGLVAIRRFGARS